MKKLIVFITVFIAYAQAQKIIPLRLHQISQKPIQLSATLDTKNNKLTQTFSGSLLETYNLSNGLTVILYEDKTQPDVFGMVAVKVGSKNDPADATGMAHYQEHMLFKGTSEIGTTNWQAEKVHIDAIFNLYDQLGKATTDEERKKIQEQINQESLKAGEYEIPNEFEKLLKSIGSTGINAFTSPDQTVYFNSFPESQMEKWLDLYSHRLIEPVFRLFQAELEVIYEEKNLYNDNFSTALLEEFQKRFYKKHPYGQQTTIGTTEHLKNPSLTKMYNFFKTYYVPNNMALIICGNFDVNETKPLIEKYFGRLQPADVPKFPEYIEEPFKGREFFEAKLSPIRIGILGYRTVPAGHADEPALKVAARILSNKNKSGLLDRLELENKLMAAAMIPMNLIDYGGTYVLYVPKIIGQKFETAEQLVVGQIEKLAKGEFEDWQVEAAKNELYREFKISTETNTGLAMELMQAFCRGEKPEEVLQFGEKIKKITREQIIDIAKKYYGPNYLSFHSKMGFPKKQKLDKPGYAPIIPKAEAVSDYAARFLQQSTPTVNRNFVNFTKDMTELKLSNNRQLYVVYNPKNDIFTLTIKVKKGELENKALKYAAFLMNYAGADTMSLVTFKKELSRIGCSLEVQSDESWFTVEMEGIESNLKPALQLLKSFIENPKLAPEKLQVLIDAENANRKMEKSEPDNVSEALVNYVLYGEKSPYLNRFSMKEIKKINTDSIVTLFKNTMLADAEIHYCGQKNSDEVKQLIDPILGSTPKISPAKIKTPEPVEFKENTVYLVAHSKALQSKINVLAIGNNYDTQADAYIDAFNQYFSGSFSGLVMQEIREYRSLAYRANATFNKPELLGQKTIFKGYVGTQADKTLEALEVYRNLIKTMPEKPNRIDNIRNYLLIASSTARPHFRELSQQITKWKAMGFSDDPMRFKLPQYEKLKFQDILDFYKNNLQPKPIVYTIVGDKKRIDLKKVSEYGKVIQLKDKQLFR